MAWPMGGGRQPPMRARPQPFSRSTPPARYSDPQISTRASGLAVAIVVSASATEPAVTASIPADCAAFAVTSAGRVFAVSYTHLDVYKRQPLIEAYST